MKMISYNYWQHNSISPSSVESFYNVIFAFVLIHNLIAFAVLQVVVSNTMFKHFVASQLKDPI